MFLLRCIRSLLDFKTAPTIATSIVHSKLDYCNSIFLNLKSTQIKRLQLIQNSFARAVTRTPRHHHIAPILKSLHWLIIPERIHFKVLLFAYNSLQYSQPTYLCELFTIQQTRSTRSSFCLGLSRLPVTSHLMFSNRLTPRPSLHLNSGMACHLNSAVPLYLRHHCQSQTFIWLLCPLGLPLKIKVSSLQELIPESRLI